MSSSSIRPLSPPRPSSASVTTTTVSTSPPTSAGRSTTAGGSASGVNTASSSVSSPPPPGAAGGVVGPAQLQPHLPHHPHHFQPMPQGGGPSHPNAATAASGAGGQAPPPPPVRRRQNSASTSAAAGGPLSSSSSGFPPISPTNPSHLPTESQQAQIAQARTALVASIGNALDTELQTRASLLHANQAAIERQERDVERALRELRKEDDKLMKVLNDGSRKVKELGDVQNWAERLERDFLVLEETMRLVDRGQQRRRRRSGSGSGSGSESGSWSGSESGSGSGSWSGSERGSIVGEEDEEGDVRMRDDGDEANGVQDAVDGKLDTDKGKRVAIAPDPMDIDPAQIPLPTEDASTTAPRDIVHIRTAEQNAQTPAQPSPGATSWLRRFIWRAPG